MKHGEFWRNTWNLFGQGKWAERGGGPVGGSFVVLDDDGFWDGFFGGLGDFDGLKDAGTDAAP